MTRRIWVAGLLALPAVLVAALFVLQWQAFNQSRRLVERTYEIMERSQVVLRSAIDGETGQRGFLVTRRDSYLEPFQRARTETSRALAALRERVADNSEQAARIDGMTALWSQVETLLARGVDVARRAASDDEIRDILADDAAKAAMDRFRAEQVSFVAAERRLLDQRLAALAQTESLVNWSIGALVLLGVVALGMMFRSLTRQNRALETAIVTEKATARDLAAARERLNIAVEETQIKLGDASSRLAAAIENAPLIVASQDRNLVYRWLSGAALKVPAETIIGRSDDDILVEPARTKVIEAKRAVLAGGEPRRFETAMPEGEGRSIFLINLLPTRDAGGVIDGVTSVAIDVTEQRDREAHVRLLMRELQHRSKNTLAVVQAMARQTAATSGSLDHFLDRFAARLTALGASHALLVEEGWRGARVHELIRSQLGHYVDLIGRQVFLDGPELFLPVQAAQNIGLALHELATNAAKYGALSTAQGRVDIVWSVAPDAQGRMTADLDWRESGGPPVVAPTRRGFGRTIIERTVSRAVAGEVTIDYLPEGVRWRLRFPLDPDADLADGDAPLAPDDE
jgi:two-component sensor histidine kinase/CHASE3 domain sensor protein